MDVLVPITFLLGAAAFAAIQTVRAKQLRSSALWLASVSALLSIVFYLMGGHQVAVIELSVGAGLVTVLFVFAINVAGEESMDRPSLIPKPLAWGFVIASMIILGLFFLPLQATEKIQSEHVLEFVLWDRRGLDVLVQVVLIFAGVLGLLGLLAESKAPLDQPMVDEVSAERESELQALERQSAEMVKRSQDV